MRRLALPALLVVLALLASSAAASVRPPAVPAADCVYLPMLRSGSARPGAPDGVAVSAECLPRNLALPTATATATASPTDTATASPTDTATASPTDTATATASPTDTATPSATSVPQGELTGDVRLRPAHALIETIRRPVRYLIVLDASGSMSADFAGRCDVARSPQPPTPRGYWQCTNGPAGAPPIEVSGTGDLYWWSVPQERRIAVAKQAAASLARRLNLVGAPGYDPRLPHDQLGVVWFNHQAARTGAANFSGFLDDLAAAEASILAAGSYNGDPYRTMGGSNIGAGLYRAALALDDAPAAVVFGGESLAYIDQVLLLTDSVANWFLSPNAPNLTYGASDPPSYASGHPCRTLPNVRESAPCQTTAGGGPSIRFGAIPAGLDRPITQAVLVSRQELQASGAFVSVVMLSNVSDMGMKDGVASTPDAFYAAPELELGPGGETNVDRIIQQLPGAPLQETCTPVVADWITAMGVENRPVNTPLTFPAVGEVILSSAATDQVYRAPILADAATGDLSYRFGALPAGAYELRAFLYYRGADGRTRLYATLEAGGERLDALAVTITGAAQALDPLSLVLNGDLCAQP